MESFMIAGGGIDAEYMKSLEKSGDLEEYIEAVLSRVTWNRRTKRTTISKLLLANIGHFIESTVETDHYGVPLMRKTATGGMYYARIGRYFYECKKRCIDILGVFCYCCDKLILLGESCISASKGTGKKYYHIRCALLKGVV
jgi:hypothetical protein